MRSEDEIRARYEERLESPELNRPPSSIQINAPNVLIQLEAKTEVETLAWVLGEKVPKDELAAYDAKRLNR